MITFVVGIGECGKNIVLQLYYQLRNNIQCQFLMKNFHFFITDKESIEKMINDIESKGISKEVINSDDEIIKQMYRPLYVSMITPTEILHEAFYDLNDSAECFNIFSSAGGCTGGCSGTSLLEKLRNKSKDTSRTLYMATIVLPFNNDEEWKHVNSAINIAKYSKICDGILIADNEHAKGSKSLDMDKVHETVNELLSNVWIWMSACSSPQIDTTQCIGASEFKRIFNIGVCGASLVVPCYMEVPVEKLNSISLEWFVYRTIIENCAVACSPDTSKRILVIVIKPFNVGCPRSESQIKDYISKELQNGLKTRIDVVFINRKVKHARIVALLIAPKISRLEEFENKFRYHIEKGRLFENDMFFEGLSRDEAIRIYKNYYNIFKKYLECLNDVHKL